jgi:hypothetical protein
VDADVEASSVGTIEGATAGSTMTVLVLVEVRPVSVKGKAESGEECHVQK